MYDFFNKTCPLENSPFYDQDSFWTDGHKWNAHRIGWTISGAFALVDTIFALVLIWLHLRNYNRPEFQRYYVRIIFMIPVYSVVSWLGYRFYRASTYYEFGRDAYEAIVVCSFMILMCNFLGSELENKFNAKKRQGLIFPLCCIRVNPSSWYFLETIKWCVLQFAIINPAVSITAIILESQHLLCPESWSLAFGNSWLQIIKAVSVTLATYFLIEFYYIIHKDIAQYRPLLKFIGIKLVIFLTFYQQMLFSILAHFGVIKATQYWSTANVEFGLGALALTVEMFLFSILYVFAYSHKEFLVPGKRTPVFRSAVDAFNIFDLFVEVWRNMKWLFLAVILRRPYVRTREDGKFDIYDALNGKRDVAAYGGPDSYAMIDSPPHRHQNPVFRDEEEIPSILVPGGATPPNGKHDYEEVESQPAVRPVEKGYTNTYGQEAE